MAGERVDASGGCGLDGRRRAADFTSDHVWIDLAVGSPGLPSDTPILFTGQARGLPQQQHHFPRENWVGLGGTELPVFCFAPGGRCRVVQPTSPHGEERR